ncbi:MAG TPA: MlaD family protein [Candidatus Binatia bacterium]|jgi:paraquat-inducible protein B|nr:MlaD family protein [Candidatus Binatia bacterium]
MGKKANPAVIGAFVVGAIALAVLGIVLLGSGQFFKDTSKFVLYFSGSVDGLATGAPVKFKGVQIGSVSEIKINLGSFRPDDVRIPVIIEVDNDRLIAENVVEDPTKPDRLKYLIEQGLRAQLQPQSLLTGLLFVQLDILPNTPIEYFATPNFEYLEIPTVPTVLEQAQSVIVKVIASLQKADLEGLVTSIRGAVDGIEQLVNSEPLKAALGKLPDTVDNVNGSLESLRTLTRNLDGKVGPLALSLDRTSDAAAVTLAQIDTTLQGLQWVVQPDARLSVALGEIAEAARSIRLLADFLERNPGALLRGRTAEE